MVFGVSGLVLALLVAGLYVAHLKLLKLFADKPAEQYRRQLIMLGASLFGLVISASWGTWKCSRQVFSRPARSAKGRVVGVPPPKNIVVTRRSLASFAACSISKSRDN